MNQEKTTVNWYAHGARYYDPQLARWHCSDPLAELYSSSSSYSYVRNNPINFIDPNGMSEMSSQVHNQLDIEGGHNFYIWEMANKLGGGGRLRPDPNSWNNLGRYSHSPGPVGIGKDKYGNDVNLFQDPVTGETYYNVDYVKDFWEKYTNEEGVTRHRYMKTVPDGSKRVLYDGDSEKESLTLAGLGLITDWSKVVATVYQNGNEAIRAAAIRNGIPTEVIDDIIRQTGNFKHMAKWVGRGFIASGVVVNVIYAGGAISEGEYADAAMAVLDASVGVGTAILGGPLGIILYGGYMLIMHQPAVPSPAYIADPLSPWNTLPRIDNTYVAPNYNY